MDMNDFAKINTVYGSYFNEKNCSSARDSSSSLFAKNVNVEISMIAIL
jgi:2-iminobutanoate/2-iminopropanoate deaminase